ncbi:hypothetical protein VTK56DRAFT_5801 [Thermocarpiscus australiensis]
MALPKLSLAAAGLLCSFGSVEAYAIPALSVGRSTILRRSGNPLPEYDYIVIGGGTSGLTVADRLTGDGKHMVLVLERGIFKNGSSVTTVSQGFWGITDTANFLNISSVPQAGLNNRQIGVVAARF